MVYKTTPTVTQQGLSTVSVALPYSSVVAAWERAGDTDTSRRTGIIISSRLILEDFIQLALNRRSQVFRA